MPTQLFPSHTESQSSQGPREFPLRYQLEHIWEIIGIYCTPRDLEALSLVNLELCKVIRSLVFKQLIFEVDHEDYDGVDPEDLQLVHEERASAAVGRFLGLSSNENIACQVRSWYCDGTYSAGNIILEKYHQDTIPIFFDTLHRYTALKKLVLIGVQVDTSSLGTIAMLGNLETLDFDGVDFEDSFNITNPLPLKALRIEDEEDQNSAHTHAPFDFCRPERLEFVVLNCRFSMDLPFAILTMLLSKNCSSLVQLEITLNESTTPLFFTLLERCSQLQGLTINEDPSDFDRNWFIAHKGLTRRACRHLSDFAGPAIAALKIIQGRPIRRLFIRGSGVEGSYCPVEDTLDVLTAVETENVTELHFERTKTGDSRKLLQRISELQFSNLRILAIPIDDRDENANLTDHDIICMLARLKGKDDTEEDEAHDLQHRFKQYESCYDIETLGNLSGYLIRDADGRHRTDIRVQHYVDGYPRLLADIVSGIIDLPKSIVKLHINQSRIFKRMPFTKFHELAIMIAFADLANERLTNLSYVSLGIENVYHKAWQVNMFRQWGKPKVYARVEGRPEPILTGTLVMFPKVPKTGAFKLNLDDVGLAVAYEEMEPAWWETQGCLAQ